MGFKIRPADLLLDLSRIVELLLENVTPQSTRERYEWLYLNNPSGLAKVWVAVSLEQDIIMGTAAIFPRLLSVNGKKENGWVLGDFCISEQYRTLGPAVLLQRACLEGVRLERNSIWYDFPSTAMLAVYKRLHLASSLSMVRLAKPLRIDRKVQAITKIMVVVKGVSYIGNRILAWKSRKTKRDTDISLSLHEGECSEEFTDLAENVGEQWGTCVYRSASYLNWRYVRNPLDRYEIVTARQNGKILAYLVFAQAEEDALIVDLFGIHDFSVFEDLIQWVVWEMIQRKAITVSVPLSDQHPLIQIFRNLGFQVRETSPVVIADLGNDKRIVADHDLSKPWCLMQGDRDV